MSSSQPAFSASSIVGEDVGAFLRRREMAEFDRRHLGHAEFARGEQPAMAGDDAMFAIDQNRIGEAEFPDGRRDLRDLRIGVGARVSGVGIKSATGAFYRWESLPWGEGRWSTGSSTECAGTARPAVL